MSKEFWYGAIAAIVLVYLLYAVVAGAAPGRVQLPLRVTATPLYPSVAAPSAAGPTNAGGHSHQPAFAETQVRQDSDHSACREGNSAFRMSRGGWDHIIMADSTHVELVAKGRAGFTKAPKGKQPGLIPDRD